MNLRCRHRLALPSCRPRAFALPAAIARMENGVLEVTLPSKQGSATTRIAHQ